MRPINRVAIAATCVLTAASLGACGSSDTAGGTAQATQSAVSGEVTVFAAASLQEAFEQIAAEVMADNPDLTITFDFQGSQDLVSSLAEGASADVLATANNSTMSDAVAQDLVSEQTEFATNVLTLIVPEGNPAGVTGLDSSLESADLVICAPDVPCGAATVELAEALGISLNPVSEEQKVTDVRGKVESGEAEAGIVYTTDAIAAEGVEQIEIPDGGVVNHYPIALTRSAGNPTAAQVFVDAVLSPRGQEILASYGFGAPAAEGQTAGPDAGATATPGTEGTTGTDTETGAASPANRDAG
ncbi:MAG: molybdate ABC transporter substrate-binding protein [Actinomyces sp.]|uniref:molybdate ABC transporter substrate-binding protein n=1 Tax=Actinomyces sp. TaxID=29317 RepID=UPI0026DDB120|nr:molybdate ABC transporter substrate-binding protein [Actinomyces sp.]MDO4242293.1 molybdate ABC transporter substrate-binding protein [Actinomyces sp.]